MKKSTWILPLFLSAFISCSPPSEQNAEAAKVTTIQILPPQELYGDLFYEVQSRSDLFHDSKTFVDAKPKREVDEILSDFENLENKQSTEVMMGFLENNFVIPGYEEPGNIPFESSPSQHIENLWDLLERPADTYETGPKFLYQIRISFPEVGFGKYTIGTVILPCWDSMWMEEMS